MASKRPVVPRRIGALTRRRPDRPNGRSGWLRRRRLEPLNHHPRAARLRPAAASTCWDNQPTHTARPRVVSPDAAAPQVAGSPPIVQTQAEAWAAPRRVPGHLGRTVQAAANARRRSSQAATNPRRPQTRGGRKPGKSQQSRPARHREFNAYSNMEGKLIAGRRPHPALFCL